MNTETTTAADNTNQASAGDSATTADTATSGTTTTTVLTGADGRTAEGAEAGEKGADAGTDDKSTEGDGEKKDDAKTEDGEKSEGPPEKYEFTMPDGMALDEALAEKVDPVLRELNLTNEQANKLAATFAEYRASEAQRQTDAYAQQVEDWGKAAKDDKEFGGAKFDENVAHAQKFLATFGTPELKALLADGLGNHPELIRVCARAGKALQEDGGIVGKSTTQKSTASLMFDHPTSQPK